MAAADFFDISISGYGGHAAMPHATRDPIYVATALVQMLQSIVSRNVNPIDAAVVSATGIHGGSAYNVIPKSVDLRGTVRCFSDRVREDVRDRVREICEGVSRSFNVSVEVATRDAFSVLNNHKQQSELVARAARKIVGKEHTITEKLPKMGSEDFADMLLHVPGAYCWVWHSGSIPVQNDKFLLGDDFLPVAASMLAEIAMDAVNTTNTTSAQHF
jgi:amidohydrolase